MPGLRANQRSYNSSVGSADTRTVYLLKIQARQVTAWEAGDLQLHHATVTGTLVYTRPSRKRAMACNYRCCPLATANTSQDATGGGLW